MPASGQMAASSPVPAPAAPAGQRAKTRRVLDLAAPRFLVSDTLEVKRFRV